MTDDPTKQNVLAALDAPIVEGEARREITLAEFLERVPPAEPVVVSKLFVRKKEGGIRTPGTTVYSTYELATPRVQLYCTNEKCGGLRFFKYTGLPIPIQSLEALSQPRIVPLRTYLQYLCSNCLKTSKTYAVEVTSEDVQSGEGECIKFGEQPAYGPPTPARLIRLFDKEADTFLKGRRCESQGLGIGAFAYYRRVVEIQKNRIFDEIIRVAETIGADGRMVATLRSARDEVQFSKALAAVKDAMPAALLIKSHNPITLLHSALSDGLHERSDARCLELAHDVRVVLVELAERIGEALKEETELNTAVSRLLSAKRDGTKAGG